MDTTIFIRLNIIRITHDNTYRDYAFEVIAHDVQTNTYYRWMHYMDGDLAVYKYSPCEDEYDADIYTAGPDISEYAPNNLTDIEEVVPFSRMVTSYRSKLSQVAKSTVPGDA